MDFRNSVAKELPGVKLLGLEGATGATSRWRWRPPWGGARKGIRTWGIGVEKDVLTFGEGVLRNHDRSRIKFRTCFNPDHLLFSSASVWTEIPQMSAGGPTKSDSPTCRLPSTLMFDHPNTNAIAAFAAEQLASVVTATWQDRSNSRRIVHPQNDSGFTTVCLLGFKTHIIYNYF